MRQQCVVFQLNEEEYALPVQTVQEITKLSDITPMPQSTTYIKGVTNLRGTAIPVFDLHRRLGLARSHCPLGLIAQINNKTICFAVNRVEEVSFLSDIQPPPPLVDSSFIGGIVNLPNRIVMLLKPDNLIIQDESSILDSSN